MADTRVRRLVFYHINKCAGTTWFYTLKNRFNLSDCLDVSESPELTLNGEFPDFERCAQAKFIHEPYVGRDWQDCLPNTSSFAMFRDPIDRLYSDWMMICAWSKSEINASADYQLIYEVANSGFRNFISSTDRRVLLVHYNRMTFNLLRNDIAAVQDWNDVRFSEDTTFVERVLQIALGNLSRIDIVGIIERFQESYFSLALGLGFDPSCAPQAYNSRGNRCYRDSLDAESLALAKNATQLDDIVYTAALQRFDRQMAKLNKAYGADLRAAAEALYLSEVGRPRDWTIVSMGDGLRGHGWHCHEVNGSKVSRWMGPTSIATLDVPIDKSRGDLFVRARCTSFINPDQISRFRLSADGSPLDLQTWVHLGRYRYFEAVIPAHVMNGEAVLRLGFDCGFVERPPNPNDPRWLGLEFAEVEIGPPSGFRDRAPGTPHAQSCLKSPVTAPAF